MKICFLDIDGCLNSEDYALYRYESEKFDLDEFIDERAVTLLNYIIKRTDAKVVLSSSWRGDREDTEKRLKDAGFKYDIFDITPYCVSRVRGEEIQTWIDKYEKDHEPLESYVIIDDDDDMLSEQKDNFVRCKFYHGLTCMEVYKAIDILNGDYKSDAYL